MNENRLQEYKCGCCKNATTSQKWIATPYYSEISSVAEKSTISSIFAVTLTL